MKYIIMCAGSGKRWGNYLGIPKHFVEINGEKLIARTTRLLKEYGVDYIITTSDERYKEFGETIPQTYNDCEVDRFEDIGEEEICYLYGDVYYTEEALKTILETDTDEILFFGSEMEIFGIKIKNKKLFMKHKNKVKKLFLEGKVDRCIGWEVYKSLNNLPLNEYAITDRFYLIQDETDDIDCPKNYEDFKKRLEGEKMVKVKVTHEFTYGDYGKIKDSIQRVNRTEEGRLFPGDTFECDEATAKYLNGGNGKGKVVIEILEIEPEIKPDVEIKPKKKKSSKK